MLQQQKLTTPEDGKNCTKPLTMAISVVFILIGYYDFLKIIFCIILVIL